MIQPLTVCVFLGLQQLSVATIQNTRSCVCIPLSLPISAFYTLLLAPSIHFLTILVWRTVTGNWIEQSVFPQRDGLRGICNNLLCATRRRIVPLLLYQAHLQRGCLKRRQSLGWLKHRRNSVPICSSRCGPSHGGWHRQHSPWNHYRPRKYQPDYYQCR